MNQPNTPDQGYREAAGVSAHFPSMKKTTRSVYLLLTVIMSFAFVTIIGTWTTAMIMATKSTDGGPARPDEGLMMTGVIAMVFLVLLLYGQVAAGVVWVYKAWGWLPWQERYTRHWKGWVSPGQASLFLLIPYFNYYWMFVANCGLCDALDRLRTTFPTSQPAPKNLAIAACILQLTIPFPVGAIFWLIYMSKIEKMTAEMSALSATQRALPG